MKGGLYKKWIIVVFIVLFTFGLSNMGGYGRPIDERPEQIILLMNIKEYSEAVGIKLNNPLYNGISRISVSKEQDHGIAAYYLFMPVFLATERETVASMYAWHAYTYLIWFLGVIALYVILKEISRNRLTPLVGVLIYYFTPRMYAEAHYNNKDIVLLSLVFVMLAFAVRVLKRGRMCDIIGFATASGFLMNCKIIGIAVWGLTGLIAVVYTVRRFEKKKRWKRISDIALAAIFSFAVFFVLTPAMWRFPVGYIQYCISNATSFSRWDQSFLFYGKTITPMRMGVPRTYLLQWILLTTPVYIIILFLVSVIFFIRDVSKDVSKRSAGRDDQQWFYALCILTFLLPVLASVIKAPTLVLYNGWRHNYYLYAYIILCCCFSVDKILDGEAAWLGRKQAVRLLLFGLMVTGFSATFFDMMFHRSYEYMYFNPIARNIVDVEGFEGDYWNVAVLPVMENFAGQFESKVTIAPKGYAASGQFNIIQIGNLKVVSEADEADYVLYNTWMMTDKSELDDFEKVYSFEKYGHELCAVFAEIAE